MNTPKIRFKGFEDDWEQRKVSDLLQERNEQAPRSEEYPLMAFIADQGVAPKGERYDRSALVNDENGKKYKRTEYGDFIYSSNNLETGSIGLNKYGNASISPVYSIFKRTSNVDLDFLGRRFLRKDFINEMVKWRQGVVYGQWKIHESDFLKINVVVPSIEEQKRIGHCFEKLDHLITLHQRKCDETKQLKKFMLQKMFPKNGEKNPEIRFEGFTDDWEQRKFGDIASSFEYGLNVAAKEYDGENKYIRITDIDDNTHEFLTDSLTSPDIDLTGADNYKLIEGDILFARTGASVGKSYIYRNSDGLVYYAGFLIRARIKEECDAEFVFQNTLTDRYNKYIAVTSQRSGQPGVNAQEYAEFEIKVPKKEEQTKIGTYFRNLDHLITLHQRKCEKLKELKKFMLQNMFV